MVLIKGGSQVMSIGSVAPAGMLKGKVVALLKFPVKLALKIVRVDVPSVLMIERLVLLLVSVQVLGRLMGPGGAGLESKSGAIPVHVNKYCTGLVLGTPGKALSVPPLWLITRVALNDPTRPLGIHVTVIDPT